MSPILQDGITYNQVMMGAFTALVYKPWPPVDKQKPVAAQCSDGPTCPSGGAGTSTKRGPCPVKANVKYVTLGGMNVGVTGQTPACPYTAESAMSKEALKALADAQGAQGIDLDLESCMYCPDVWQKTAVNAKAANLKVQVTTVGSAASPYLPSGAGAQTQVYADGVKWLAANNDKWDSVALMLYGKNMVGQGYNICCCG
jgi:hypothetical protein